MSDDLIKRMERWGEGASLSNHMLGVRRARQDCADAAAALAEAQATIARLEAALREIIDASNNTGIEMGTVGMRVAERVEDIARAALAPKTPDTPSP